MLNSIDRIEKYTEGLTEKAFIQNFLVQDAVIRNIQIIGEASKKIEAPIRENNPQIPWKQISGMRNKVIHEYFGIDLMAVWIVVEKDLPVLKSQLIELQKS